MDKNGYINFSYESNMIMLFFLDKKSFYEHFIIRNRAYYLKKDVRKVA